MQSITSWVITFSLCTFFLSGQTLDKKTKAMVDQIVIAAENGNQRALRDLGTLLDHPEARQYVITKLEELIGRNLQHWKE